MENKNSGAVGINTDSPVYNKKNSPCQRERNGKKRDCRRCDNFSCAVRSAQYKGTLKILSDYTENYISEKDVLLIDIGTTTIVMQLFSKGSLVKTITALNRQKGFGADVISRIQASVSGHSAELMRLIRFQLSGFVSAIKKEYPYVSPSEVIIAANTTMVHLLMGYPCDTLSRYPFEPYSKDMICLPFEELAGGGINAPAVIFPAVSAFVGGDIVSGLYMCDIDLSEEINLFIDLGTNGEMALGSKHGILTASASAGPAFEGGRISCGIGSVSGAICDAELKNGVIKTIDDKPPAGICGSGMIAIISELLKLGLMDRTGLLKQPYFNNGYRVCENIYFTQSDIREFQTAGSAVRTGIEILMKHLGAEFRDIKNVYLAGGFGNGLDIKKACISGIIPYELKDRIITVGNSALGGAAKLAFSDDGKERANNISRMCKEVNLANDKDFNSMYIKNMNFGFIDNE